jgi:hypothetical protein
MKALKLVLTGTYCVLLSISQLGFAQNKPVVLSGYLREAGSRESLPGAAVYIPSLKQGTTANAFGFYSLSLPPGQYIVQFSYVGMASMIDSLDLTRSTVYDVELKPGKQLSEIEIVGDAADKSGAATLMSRMELSGQQIGAVPTLMGEKDLLKTVQLLPGVQSGNEGQSGLYVRGGGPDQNLILLDGATVYNASHLFGFFSVFNGDAIKQVSLTKGGFPARYGGRLSSVLDVTMRDGDKSQFRGELGLGVISSRFLVEGPIVRNKMSFVAAGRRTYADALLLPARWITGEDPGVGYYFYDLSGRIHYEINRKNRLFLSTYTGRDAFASRQERDEGTRRANISWGNVSGTLRWNHLASERLFVNTTFIYTDYQFNTFLRESSDARNITAGYSSGIRDWGIRSDAEYLPSPRRTVRTGISILRHRFVPSAYVLLDALVPGLGTQRVVRSYSVESGAYWEEDRKIGTRLESNIGLRLSHFTADGRTYGRAEPRVALRALLGADASIKASWAVMNQYLHLLSNTGIGLPTDLWVPANAAVGPQRSQQWAAGYEQILREGRWVFSVEGFYKQSRDVIGYRPGASFLLIDPDELDSGEPRSINWERQVTQGQQESYGAEFFLQKKKGMIKGWLGYTLSRTWLQFDELNLGERFPARYDRRHDLSLFAYHERPRSGAEGRTRRISGAFVFGTGNTVTIPSGLFQAPYPVAPGNPNPNPWFPVYATDFGRLNQYRLAPYHRLDLSIQWSKKKKWGTRSWEISVYNLYNRANPWFIDAVQRPNGTELVQYSLFGIVPALNYHFRFR